MGALVKIPLKLNDFEEIQEQQAIQGQTLRYDSATQQWVPSDFIDDSQPKTDMTFSGSYIDTTFEKLSNKDQPGGYVGLDSNLRINQLYISGLTFIFIGTWDASTGTYPTDSPDNYSVWLITAAGEIGGIDYKPGDLLIYIDSNSGWTKVDNTDQVLSVNGKQGEVVLLLNDLNDVIITNPLDAEFLSYDSTNNVWVNKKPSLAKLLDVVFTSPSQGDYLYYDGTQWVNKPLINDTVIVTDKTWSSSKIQSELDTKAEIDDAYVGTDKTWSSDLIQSELDTKAEINDSTTSTDTTWSSQKISDTVASKTEIDDNNISTTTTFSSSKIDTDYQSRDELGAANGYCPLDANAKIPTEFLTVSALKFMGSHDASTGTYPTDTPDEQTYWYISVAGTIDGVEYNVGDYVVYIDSNIGWSKTDNTERVTSVNSKTGAVELYIDDLNNLYISNPVDGEVLTYDATNSRWVNASLPIVIDDSNISTDTTFSSSKIDTDYEKLSNKGVANGYAPLDDTTKIPNEFINFPEQGFLYRGTWDASTGAYPTDTPEDKTVYYVAVEGEVNGIIYRPGDLLMYIDSTTGWIKIDNYQLVKSVNGQTGDVIVEFFLNDLLDVSVDYSTITDGSVLYYDSNDTKWYAKIIDTDKALSELTDVVLSTPASGDSLVYNGTSWINKNLISDSSIGNDTTWSSSKIQTSIDEKTEINDTVTATDTTWSSSKIDSEIDSIIDDTVSGTSTTYSSSKIDSELSTKTEIDDNNISTTTTWSSDKINNELSTKAVIDDTVVVNDKTWSSSNISNQINSLINDTQSGTSTTYSSSKIETIVDNKTEIDDNSTSTTTTWSSNKINNELSAKTEIDDSNVSTNTTFSSSKIDSTYEKVSNKNIAGGYAGLDSNGKITSDKVESITLIYKGTYDASSGVYPTDSPVNYTYWYISNPGEIDSVKYEIGDFIVYIDNTIGWTKIDNTETVTSVNGKIGDVLLTINDIDDIVISNPLSGDVLRYDSTNSVWVNSSIIDDTNVVDNKTWSSQKINDSIISKTEIDDSNISTSTTFSSSKIDSTYEKVSSKGQPNGYCPLDANGKIDSQYLQITTLKYMGEHDASTGTYPTNTPSDQTYWYISVAGAIDNIEYNVGDYIVYVDSTVGWSKIDNTERVISVNGKSGDIILTTDDISEGSTNKYMHIDDTNTSTDTVWSSSKVNDEISAISIESLSDTQIDSTTLSDGQILVYDATNSIWKNSDNIQSGAVIDDNSISTDTTWSSSKISSIGISSSTHLSDVDFSSGLNDGQLLKYDGTNSVWIPTVIIDDSNSSDSTTYSSSKLVSDFEQFVNKDQPGGYAGLDANTKIILAEMPYNTFMYADSWDPSTGDLPGVVPGAVDFKIWKASNSGDVDLSIDPNNTNIQHFEPGDLLLCITNGGSQYNEVNDINWYKLETSTVINDNNLSQYHTYSSNKIDATYQKLSEKNQPNGYPGLDGTGKIDPSQIPDLNITIGDLDDVELIDPSDGQILSYDATNSVWKNVDNLSGAQIDDTVTATDTTWSSSKISNEIEDGVYTYASDAVINDSVTGTDTTWSSSKIFTELSNKTSIDDTVTGTDTTWSSSKIDSEINSIIDDTVSSTSTTYSSSKLDSDFEKLSNKGQPNGYCPLDSNGKIDSSYLQITALQYKGNWDASTGTYPSSPNPQEYWTVSVAGTVDSIEYNVGDYLVYIDDTVQWSKIDNTERVTSVNSKTGDVVLVINDIDDVVITNPSDGELLTYDATNSIWINKAFQAATIDDTVTNTTQTWSSQKISDTISSESNSAAQALIDDTYTGSDKTWSSTQIENRITDKIIGEAPGAVIDDNQTVTTLTWSSTQIRDQIDGAVADKAVIDDANVSTDTVWSSSKTSTEINSKPDIDDTTIATDAVWSSQKVSDELSNKASIDDNVISTGTVLSSSKDIRLVTKIIDPWGFVSKLNSQFGLGELVGDILTIHFSSSGDTIVNGATGTSTSPLSDLSEFLTFTSNNDAKFLDVHLQLIFDSDFSIGATTFEYFEGMNLPDDKEYSLIVNLNNKNLTLTDGVTFNENKCPIKIFNGTIVISFSPTVSAIFQFTNQKHYVQLGNPESNSFLSIASDGSSTNNYDYIISTTGVAPVLYAGLDFVLGLPGPGASILGGDMFRENNFILISTSAIANNTTYSLNSSLVGDIQGYNKKFDFYISSSINSNDYAKYSSVQGYHTFRINTVVEYIASTF